LDSRRSARLSFFYPHKRSADDRSIINIFDLDGADWVKSKGGNTSKEVPTRLIHLVRKRDRRVPSRTEKKEKKTARGPLYDSSSAHTVGQVPNNNNNTATATSDNN
jgi:hypothetical protein